ncbi:MAG: FtsX-like permease family protein, partial [Lentisphaeria bacterium]|nr:FtsX-like permease family protein [Lentisphaeria bacterium]
EMLLDKDKLKAAKEKMRELGGIRLPGGDSEFDAFLSSYATYRTQLKSSFAKWLALQKSIPERNKYRDQQVLATHLLDLKKEGKINEWRAMLMARNFELSENELDEIIGYLDITARTERIKTLLYDADYRVRWRQVYGRNQYSRMEEKLEILDTGKAWRVFNEASSAEALKVLKEKQNTIYGAEVTRDDLSKITDEFMKRKDLRDLELQLDIDIVKKSEGFTPDQIYLMCLSFLVCVVGITNAMLMSITERFREIATLKCLGATDSFILVQIVLEAMIQGMIGGVIGLVLGFLVALISSVFQVGFRVFESFDWGMVGYAALFSMLAGVLLSVLSSLYPSAKAARMAPMEAMRVE